MMLDGVIDTPSPLDVKPYVAHDLRLVMIELMADDKKPFAALAFKTLLTILESFDSSVFTPVLNQVRVERFKEQS